jgi:hypothetical protein
LAAIFKFLDILKQQLYDYSSKSLVYSDLYGKYGEFIDHHALHPLFIEGLDTPQNNQLTEFLEIKKQVALATLITKVEAKRVLKLLTAHGIEFLPYKGHVFLSILYNQKPLRLISDLDLIFPANSRLEAFNLLRSDGYVLDGYPPEKNLEAETIFSAKGMNEIPLKKKFHNQYHSIDFHWDFAFGFLPYKLPLSYFMDSMKPFEIDGEVYMGPSDEAILYMIAIHHGGRDAWTSMKLLVDMHTFLMKFHDTLAWEKCLVALTEMRLLRPTLVGMYLANKYLDSPLPSVVVKYFQNENIDDKLCKPILSYWENSYNILSAKGRFQYEKILISIQDKGFSVWGYYYKMFQTYGIPNPIETPRLVTFPANWHFLNAFSKLVTYLYKRAFGKLIR